MGIWQAIVVMCALEGVQAPQAPPPAPSEVTFAVESGKAINVNVASPPYGSRPKEWPLLRVATARYVHTGGQPATVTLEGSIVTAARVGYRITVTLLAEGGKAVAATSAVEHVEHIEVGRVMTVLRTWKLDFGRIGEPDPVKSMRIRVLQLADVPRC